MIITRIPRHVEDLSAPLFVRVNAFTQTPLVNEALPVERGY